MAAFGSGGHKVIEHGFFHDTSLDFQTRTVLGLAVRGASEVGEVLATVARIGGEGDWVKEWSATARRVQAEAEQARDAKHLVSASSGFLRAATYWACAVGGLSTSEDTEDLLAAFRAHRHCWDAVIDCSEGAFVRVSVPYETTSLPGYLLRPDTSGQARPTLIVTNGSDGAISSLLTSAAAGALARGWNAFLYDGPGQQSMLFEQQTYFRPDWEAVLTPVVEALISRPDVDAQRLTGYGISQAGYWLSRALAYEHRLIAAETAALITTPLLITEPADEQFWPKQSRQLADLVPGRADLIAFTAEEGANYHCQPMGRLLTEERLFNWLEDFVH